MINQNLRITREKKTVLIMIRIFCKNNHKTDGQICAECNELYNYSSKRLNLCTYGNKKPACKKCSIHCYNQLMKQRIIDVMKFSGPRMLFRHPILCVRHLFDCI